MKIEQDQRQINLSYLETLAGAGIFLLGHLAREAVEPDLVQYKQLVATFGKVIIDGLISWGQNLGAVVVGLGAAKTINETVGRVVEKGIDIGFIASSAAFMWLELQELVTPVPGECETTGSGCGDIGDLAVASIPMLVGLGRMVGRRLGWRETRVLPE